MLCPRHVSLRLPPPKLSDGGWKCHLGSIFCQESTDSPCFFFKNTPESSAVVELAPVLPFSSSSVILQDFSIATHTMPSQRTPYTVIQRGLGGQVEPRHFVMSPATCAQETSGKPGQSPSSAHKASEIPVALPCIFLFPHLLHFP